MAYNRTFNADALPAFPEPERKQPNPTATSNHPPRLSSANQQASQSPPNNQVYSSKPPPPLPQQNQQPRHDPRSNSYGGSGQSRPSAQDNSLRSNSYGGSGQGRQPSPASILQPQGNYSYSSSPPSSNHRFPPQAQGQMRPPKASGHSPSPTPGAGGSDPSLMPLFRAVDKTGSGQLSEQQLGAALVNGDWSSFDPHTIRLMIRMFDTDGSGTIGFDEFCGLWSFLASWRTLFDRFDIDRSGNISLDEFSNALTAFGYRLTPEFVRFLFGQYDKYRTNQLSFDLFVQACISLKRMTDVFKRYDDDRDGFIQLSFEEFLTEILRQM